MTCYGFHHLAIGHTTSNVANLQTLTETATKMDGLLGMRGNRFLNRKGSPAPPPKRGLMEIMNTHYCYVVKDYLPTTITLSVDIHLEFFKETLLSKWI